MSENLLIDHISAKGEGVALSATGPVYVQRTTPGDNITATVTETKGVRQGQLESVIMAGPGRIDAPCPYYEVCGGCQLQHLATETYQAWKESSVRDMLTKAGVVPATWLPPVFIPQATRRRVTFAAIKRGKDLTLGFNGYRSDKIANQNICLLLTPALNDLRDKMRPYLLRILPDGVLTDVSLQDVDGSVELTLTGDFGDIGAARSQAMTDAFHALGLARIGWRAKLFDPAETLLQRAPVTKTFGKMAVEIPPAAFLQPSREGEAALTAAVLAGVKGLKKARILDLFSGCGTFSGPLLGHGAIHAVESDRPATTALQKAVPYNRGLSVERRDLFKEPVTVRELNQYDCAVFDPPRAGAKAQAELMAKAKTPLIVGVSCNPVTFITDAKLLIAGGYKLATVQMVDQFVWSTHSELVGVFRR